LLQLQRPASARAQAPARLSALRASSASPCAPRHRLSMTAVSSSSPELSVAPAASPAMVVAAPAHGRARPSAVPLFLSAASSSLVLGPSSARFLLAHGQRCSSPCVARLSRPPARRPTPASPAPLSLCRALASSDFASHRSLTHVPVGVVEFLFDQLVVASFAVESSNTSSSAQTLPHQLAPDVS
jgi:hypothetical protein